MGVICVLSKKGAKGIVLIDKIKIKDMGTLTQHNSKK